jgi:hypothetical protein
VNPCTTSAPVEREPTKDIGSAPGIIGELMARVLQRRPVRPTQRRG